MKIFNIYFCKSNPLISKNFKSLDVQGKLDFIRDIIRDGDYNLAIEYINFSIKKIGSKIEFKLPFFYYLLGYVHALNEDKVSAMIAVEKGINNIERSMSKIPFISFHPAKEELLKLQMALKIENFNLKKPKRKEIQSFYSLMKRATIMFDRNLVYEISQQKNGLILKSGSIVDPISSLKLLNIILRSENDWEVLKSMEFDFVSLQGVVTYNMSIEQIFGVFIRRTK